MSSSSFAARGKRDILKRHLAHFIRMAAQERWTNAFDPPSFSCVLFIYMRGAALHSGP